ncbi:alpha/beta fold hydrolase [uncultured Erythrobacter sp.]|uniref:esterase/lipase family protein n=1 Tax=uncultured Erythrobacter sp. TaxID=263913 RepID=UPI002628E5D8|nr:alpha/beta fold hydrolase [uncultured Erythrobacter sp.]
MSRVKPPSFGLLVRELPWLPVIAASQFRSAKMVELDFKLEGDPPPVMVIPGLLSNDGTTSLLRRTLAASGFPTYPSGFGFLTGVTAERLERGRIGLEQMHERHGGPVVIVGWSLGGIYARVLAQRHPELVKMVVTLGTPFSGDRQANNAWRIYNALNDHTVTKPNLPDDPSVKPPVHTVAIWSHKDGIIAPGCASGKGDERDAEHQVNIPHLAFGSGRVAAQRIAQIIALELAECRDGTVTD